MLPLIQKDNYQVRLTKTQNPEYKMITNKYFKDCVKKLENQNSRLDSLFDFPSKNKRSCRRLS